MKTNYQIARIVTVILLLLTVHFSFSQSCASSAPASAACGSSGSPLSSGTATVNSGTYYYSGSGALSLTQLNGGTVMICGSVTLTSLTLNSGSSFIIEAGGSLTMSAALTLNGGSMANYGTVTINSNLTLSSGSIIWNLPSSQGFTVAGTGNTFSMTGGYFINGANNSVVTVPTLSLKGGTMCMGNFTAINAVTLNSTGNYITYSGTGSPACVGVSSSSNNSNSTFTSSSNINVCLAPGETQTKANWGSAAVTTNCTGCYIVLPLNITGFIATNQGNTIKLAWSSGNITGSEVFDVEESDDGENFHSIATINAEVNQSSYVAYDNTINNIIQYYRIKETSNTGKIIYSDIQLVRTSFAQNLASLTVYPNPVSSNNSINILFNSTKQEGALLSLIDISGKLLQTKTSALITGKNHLSLDLKNAPPGIYILKVQSTSQGNFYSRVSVMNTAE